MDLLDCLIDLVCILCKRDQIPWVHLCSYTMMSGKYCSTVVLIASGSFTLSVMILENFGEEAVICDIFRTEHSMASHFLLIDLFVFVFLVSMLIII